MEQREQTRKRLTTHGQQYPNLQIQDLLKYLHQSAFGCEHMVTSLDGATASIRSEYENRTQDGSPLVEPLDGEYSRVHLSYLNVGLCAETLGKLFFASTKAEPDGAVALEQKLATARELVLDGTLPISVTEFEAAVNTWRAAGFPALHHSDAFRAAYSPAYRVISNRFIPLLPLLTNLDQLLATQEQVVLAIEGGSASGKTTLSELLRTLYDCTVFHMDDFFLRPEQRTAERYAEAGGNVDRERVLAEVLTPLRNRTPISYRRFDCATLMLSPAVTVTPECLVVVEGAYSMHPDLADYYDLSVFLDVPPQLQKQRIAARNTPELAQRFHNEWIPLENTYFSELAIQSLCDLSIPITE